jgi:hypothetical protein
VVDSDELTDGRLRLGGVALVVLDDQLDLTELTQACSPARCSGWPDGPEKLPIVPMSSSDPDAATAEPELAVLVLVLVPVLLALLLLLQAVARAATATLSADTRSRAVLRALFITGSTPKVGRNGMVTDRPGRRVPRALAWPESRRG